MAFKKGSLSIGDYYSKFRALWKELELYMSLELCCAKKERKLLEDQHIFELLGGVKVFISQLLLNYSPLKLR